MLPHGLTPEERAALAGLLRRLREPVDTVDEASEVSG